MTYKAYILCRECGRRTERNFKGTAMLCRMIRKKVTEECLFCHIEGNDNAGNIQYNLDSIKLYLKDKEAELDLEKIYNEKRN